MASIYKRSNGWAASVYYKLNGKDKRKVKSGFGTKSDAQKWAFEIESEKNKGKLVSGNTLFIDEFNKWYEVFKEPKVSWQTKNWYGTAVRCMESEWQDKKVNEVKASDFQKLINNYSKGHVKSSVYRVKNIIAGFVRYAVDEDLINKDFTRNVEVIAEKESKSDDLKFLENDELEKLIKRAKQSDSVTAKMILTGAYTGLRYAELAGLTSDDVDLDNDVIHVVNSWDMVHHFFKPTKTKNSLRDVSIPKELHDILANFVPDGGFIFKSANNYPPTNNACNKTLRAFLEKDESKVITMHGLRHTHASYLLSHEVSVHYVSERLGHANVNITLGIYAHLLEEQREAENSKALSLLDNL